MTNSDLSSVIEVLCRVGGLAGLEPDQDFYEAGMTSLQALPLLLEMEDKFQVSIPDDQFILSRTARKMTELIVSLKSS
jgi:acyl carrier protein